MAAGPGGTGGTGGTEDSGDPAGATDAVDSPGPADPRAGVDALFSRTYEELRRLAVRVRGGDRRATLNPTALVNEAWLKLAGSPPSPDLSPLHFKRIAARAMRQVLVEAARRKQTHKRGDGLAPITFDEEHAIAASGPAELLALDSALETLAAMNARQAALVEARFFGGLEMSECAELLQLSEATVQRDWRVARAWLSQQLQDS